MKSDTPIFALIDADQIESNSRQYLGIEINRDYGMFNRAQAPNFYT